MSTDDERPYDFLDRIVVDPLNLVGMPVIKGTRMPVSKILNLVANGSSFEQIVEDFPAISVEAIRAALLYAGARIENEELVDALPTRP